jgi:hypothetical protein
VTTAFVISLQMDGANKIGFWGACELCAQVIKADAAKYSAFIFLAMVIFAGQAAT